VVLPSPFGIVAALRKSLSGGPHNSEIAYRSSHKVQVNQIKAGVIFVRVYLLWMDEFKIAIFGGILFPVFVQVLMIYSPYLYIRKFFGHLDTPKSWCDAGLAIA
jgi:hypothetical protein